MHVFLLWPESGYPEDVRDLLATIAEVEEEGVGPSCGIKGDGSTPIRRTHSTSCGGWLAHFPEGEGVLITAALR